MESRGRIVRRGAWVRRLGVIATMGGVWLLSATALAAEPAAPPAGPLGESVEQLIQIAHRFSPEVAAAALEATAALARVEAAGSLDDPTLRVLLEDIPRSGSGVLPNNGPNTRRYQVFQEIPFPGKRALKEEIAGAQGRQAQVRKHQVEIALAYQIKAAYAEYHRAHVMMEQTESLLDVVRSMARLAQARYAQGLGQQADVTGAEAERAALSAELARTKAERRKAQVRLNTLMTRAAAAPLVDKPRPRRLPPRHLLEPAALTDRALRDNPELHIKEAEIDAADRTRDLADRSWYPDFGVGLGVMQRSGEPFGYEAMVEMKIPLRWGLRRAQQAEATAMASAARAKRQQARLEVESMVHEAQIALEALREQERLLRDLAVPQANIALQSATRAYELSKGEFIPVLVATQNLKKARLDYAKVLYDTQIGLAQIEKLIGGEL